MNQPCSQNSVIERLETKVDKVLLSHHALELLVTEIRVTQKLQNDFVETKSKSNGKIYGAIFGSGLSLITGVILLGLSKLFT